MVAGAASVDEAWVVVRVDGAEVAARLGCSAERTLTVYDARVDKQRHREHMASWIECGLRLGLCVHC